MRRVNKTKLFLLLAVWAVALGLLSYALKKGLEIAPESLESFLVSGVVIGGGIMGGISFLKWLVSRGKMKWLEEDD